MNVARRFNAGISANNHILVASATIESSQLIGSNVADATIKMAHKKPGVETPG